MSTDDWSRGWARRKLDGSPEDWGDYTTSEGAHVRMYRGKNNRVRWYDEGGEQHGAEQRNVAPAVVAAAMWYWIDNDAPLTGLMIRQDAALRRRYA